MIENNMDDRQIWQSQNFLKRPEFVANLVDLTNLTNKDLVVEIGPGKGIITKELSKKAGKVIAVEKDRKLATNLQLSFHNIPQVEIIETDFMRWQLPKEPYKVFSNIPFNMTADIVKKLTEDKHEFEGVVVYCLETVDDSSSAHSRYFVPFYGIDEDPVTGSTNGPMLMVLKRLGLIDSDENDSSVIFEQGDFIGRRGRVSVSYIKATNELYISGKAVTVLKGEIIL